MLSAPCEELDSVVLLAGIVDALVGRADAEVAVVPP